MQTDPNTEVNVFDLPDDEVMGMVSAPAAPAPAVEPAAVEPAAVEPAVVEPVVEPAVVEPAVVEPVLDPLATPDGSTPTPPVVADPPVADPMATPATPAAPEPAKPGDVVAEPAAKVEPQTPAEPTADDHKSFYERILKNPIKANGKQIQLQSPEEAEQLIKMGLNYTKKMQAWQPRMRVVTMLENNNLLDEGKLAHLIDLSKGDPAAIQKLLADSKFDPMTVDADKAASYKPGNHQVSDAELSFNAAMDDLESTETGVQLIAEVAKQWDEQSRQAVYQDPSILHVINEQKAIGLYARITGEMDRLKTLGHLQGVPFLQAYRAVGDMLNDRGLLKPEPQKQPEPQPVETRVATPAPQVTNSDKAKAASPTKATPAAPKTETNFLDVPDDQFLKSLHGRL
jgi:hypothetical protein